MTVEAHLVEVTDHHLQLEDFDVRVVRRVGDALVIQGLDQEVALTGTVREVEQDQCWNARHGESEKQAGQLREDSVLLQGHGDVCEGVRPAA